MKLHHLRSGSGKPLLLINGLGGSARSWSSIWTALVERRDLVAVDLPGFGDTPPLAGETSIRSLSDAVTSFIDAQGLRGIDGQSRVSVSYQFGFTGAKWAFAHRGGAAKNFGALGMGTVRFVSA